MNRKKFSFILLLGIFVVVCRRRSSLFSFTTDSDTSLRREKDQSTERRPKILLWTDYFRTRDLWKKFFIRIQLNECEESRCDFSTNRDEIEEVDAVIFNNFDIITLQLPEVTGLNQLRSPHQIFIYLNVEPPNPKGQKFLKRFKNFFNWTMTYRKDSDVYMPYGITKRKTGSVEGGEIPYVSQEELSRKDFAVWMASHCHTTSKRERFIQALNQTVPVSVYGKCGNLKCGKRTMVNVVGGRDPSEDECTAVVKGFAFYLAFENTLCTEYVTEKFFRTLTLGVIPVVYGGADYTTIGPPRSFIDSKDFDSTEDLGKYLKLVYRNATLYNEYLKWREDFEVDIGNPYRPLTCDLCKKLHQSIKQRTPKYYEDLEKWYLEINVTCFSYETFFQDVVNETP